MEKIKNIVKVTGKKEYVDAVFEHLETLSTYDFYEKSPLKSNLNNKGFHKFIDAQRRQD